MRKSRPLRESGVPILLGNQRSSVLPRNRSSSVEMRSRASGSISVGCRSVSESRRPSSIASNQISRGMSAACGKVSLPGGFPYIRGSSVDNKRLMKDPRPLTDKAYQNRCLASLVDFLVEDGYPYPVSAKKLTSPSKKDFENMFEFLCRHMEPKFQVVKIETDAPWILKHLRYPFLVAKSTFLSVNRITWPPLLGILTWLVGLNKYILGLDIKDFFEKPDFENSEEQYNLIKYILESYANGEDDPAKDTKVYTELATKRYSPDYSIEELEKRVSSRKKELEKLKTESDYYRQLHDSSEKKEDIEKLEEYIEKMENHIVQKEKICQEIAANCTQKESELKALEAEVAEKEHIYSEQGFDGEHALNFLTMQKQDLIKQLEEKTERNRNESKSFWDLEIENAKLLSKISTNSQEFSEGYSNLRMAIKDVLTPLKSVDMPAASKLLNEFMVNLPDFDMKLSSDSSEWNRVITALEKTIGYVAVQKDHVMKIHGAQKHYASELEMQMSELKIKEDVKMAQAQRKERDLEIKEKERQQVIEKFENKSAEIKEHCGKVHDYILKYDKENVLLKQQIEENRSLNQKLVADYETRRKQSALNYLEAENKIKQCMKENNDYLLKMEGLMTNILEKIQK